MPKGSPDITPSHAVLRIVRGIGLRETVPRVYISRMLYYRQHTIPSYVKSMASLVHGGKKRQAPDMLRCLSCGLRLPLELEDFYGSAPVESEMPGLLLLVCEVEADIPGAVVVLCQGHGSAGCGRAAGDFTVLLMPEHGRPIGGVIVVVLYWRFESTGLDSAGLTLGLGCRHRVGSLLGLVGIFERTYYLERQLVAVV